MMQEVELSESLLKELNKILEKLQYNKDLCNHEDYSNDITKAHCLKRTSPEALDTVLQGHDRNVATADENVLKLPPEFVKEGEIPRLFEELMVDFCNAHDKEKMFHVTGKFWYPSNGYMGWHTNNTYPGFRFYCAHAEEANKSFFRYMDPDTGEIITSWDRKGWMGRVFKIDKNKPLWHCVYSETNRVSTGCNIELEQ